MPTKFNNRDNFEILENCNDDVIAVDGIAENVINCTKENVSNENVLDTNLIDEIDILRAENIQLKQETDYWKENSELLLEKVEMLITEKEKLISDGNIWKESYEILSKELAAPKTKIQQFDHLKV